MSEGPEDERHPEVEVMCPSCRGEQQSKSFPCQNCDGTGFIRTELGRKIMAMVLRNLGQTFRDAIGK
jgi:DnaJ-class molecular chaperone